MISCQEEYDESMTGQAQAEMEAHEDLQEHKEMMAMEVTKAITETRKTYGLTLSELAYAIKMGIGDDLEFLIKELKD